MLLLPKWQVSGHAKHRQGSATIFHVLFLRAKKKNQQKRASNTLYYLFCCTEALITVQGSLARLWHTAPPWKLRTEVEFYTRNILPQHPPVLRAKSALTNQLYIFLPLSVREADSASFLPVQLSEPSHCKGGNERDSSSDLIGMAKIKLLDAWGTETLHQGTQ